MASITMTASLLGGSAMAIGKQPTATGLRRGVVVAKATSTGNEGVNGKSEESSGRRDLVFAAAAAAVCSVAKVAMADEPRRGTAEAKKKYAPICVTMPTARICRN
ncbi:hypothetical protein NMG60_11033712 [Bertholletia excelsa]